jgi:hypothetical protein
MSENIWFFFEIVHIGILLMGKIVQCGWALLHMLFVYFDQGLIMKLILLEHLHRLIIVRRLKIWSVDLLNVILCINLCLISLANPNLVYVSCLGQFLPQLFYLIS